MKHHLLPLLTSCFIASLSSCGSRSTETAAEALKSDAATPEQKGTAIYLEGMYATSTRLPLAEYSLENLFDADTMSYWSTPLGAGPDEGFVIYFPESIYIEEIELAQAKGDGLASITDVSVYADGHNIGDFNISLPIRVDKALTSLFIKITSTDKSTVEYVTNENLEDVSLEMFDKNYATGLSDMRISDGSGTLRVMPPLAVRGSVSASSTLNPADAYAPAQLFDSRREFVWAEGAKSGGEGEKLTFVLSEDQRVSAIKIWNGYQRSAKHFASNARIKSFEFGPKNGNKSSYTLEDNAAPQLVTLGEPVNGKEFELTVLEVYPGERYKDLVVSEILFMNEDVPFVISDASNEQTMKAFVSTAKGSVLENYLDKRLKNVIEYPDYSSSRSLILRSNRTFVLYDHTVSGDEAGEEDKEVVADGNWEIVEQGDRYAKVRIFGKLFNLSETLEYYKGNTTKEFVTIFQDNLHITPSGIKGEKYVEAFHQKSPASL